MYRIILASESPRRKEIMDQMGIPYTVMPANVNENALDSEPSDLVKVLASLKARDVAGRIEFEDEDLIIIAADTLVFHKGRVLGKPKDRQDAIQMLESLSDDVHEVYSGVCIILRRSNQNHSDRETEEITFSVCTQVVVQPINHEQIEDYVDSKEPQDKAGAYAIQGGFGIYIKEIHGDYYNVVGLPIAQIHEKLLIRGINIKKLK